MADIDVKLATNLVLGAILNHKGAMDKLAKSMSNAGPKAPMVLGKALVQDFLHAKKAIIKNKLPIAPEAWATPGGAFDQVIKQVCELLSAKLGQTVLDGKFMAAVKHALMMGLHADDKAPQPAPEEAGPAMPEMGGMQ